MLKMSSIRCNLNLVSIANTFEAIAIEIGGKIMTKVTDCGMRQAMKKTDSPAARSTSKCFVTVLKVFILVFYNVSVLVGSRYVHVLFPNLIMV